MAQVLKEIQRDKILEAAKQELRNMAIGMLRCAGSPRRPR